MVRTAILTVPLVSLLAFGIALQVDHGPPCDQVQAKTKTPTVSRKTPKRPEVIPPPDDLLIQYDAPPVQAQDVESTLVTYVSRVRSFYDIDGSGLTAAVLDTGIRTTHVDFRGKIVARRNFTFDDGGNPNNVEDRNGHGTNVAGVICGNGLTGGTRNAGIAPGANVVPLKVLSNTGWGNFAWVEQALDWVIANHSTYNITVVNMSLSDSGNYTSDFGTSDRIRQQIQVLAERNIPVVIAAGNGFFSFDSDVGMGYPAIIPESISVGAVFDASIGRVAYRSGAIAYSTGPWRVTPFSQRLPFSASATHYTKGFAPGAALTAAGIRNDRAVSVMHGTSQAAPVLSGIILLCQQFCLREFGRLPTIAELQSALEVTQVFDGDDEDDNVENTNELYPYADAEVMLTTLGTGSYNFPPSFVLVDYDRRRRELMITPVVTPSGRPPNVTLIVWYDFEGESLVVSGLHNTYLNGTEPYVTFPLPRESRINITGNFGNGNDFVMLYGLSVDTLSLNMGSGNDGIEIWSYTFVNRSRCLGGPGADTFNIFPGARVRINGNRQFP
ncbi:MAG: hypothetical protein KatS3mg113_0130 [Planctomycetaceae bacterium]|nr:MAG: hypothetical protein KatS3mg113_0130 [Planctomycetaceae bacterium]